MATQYLLGIDLGTTNTVLAYTPLQSEPSHSMETPVVEILPIPQFIAPGIVEQRKSLPSFVYLPAESEIPHFETLPWKKGQTGGQTDKQTDRRPVVVGEFARKRSAEVPDRSISAAKSWLCHSKVDRRSPILPWNAPEDIGKISPMEVSRLILRHLVDAWESAFPESPLAEQMTVLTVPASFDSSARELTQEAALAAGIPRERLLFLEEPQAAVYSWLCASGDQWRKTLKPGDILLVCDIGGGTTDLTLIGVEENDGELTLNRLAVGNHLLVGGDNMDLALAHHAAELLAEKGTKLDPWQSVALWHSARDAKETLLNGSPEQTHKISVLGRGSRLIGGTVSVEVSGKTVRQLLRDGFFPAAELTDKPRRRSNVGFREIGLPYEQDSAITKHLAAFLNVSAEKNGTVRPTHVLLNGGVFQAKPLEDRIFDVLARWFPDPPPQKLSAVFDLDHAVARGAAFYGLSKQQGGLRIHGGIAQSYYVGIETAGLAIPGASRPMKALCVASFGMEEGTGCDVPSEDFALTVGEPAVFRFFRSAIRREDVPGVILDSAQLADGELQETDSLEAMLPGDETAGEEVTVRFHTKITELGVLELWSIAAEDSGKRWKLEFSVRGE
jgi:molecular chaperone DnaK (HSP70)